MALPLFPEVSFSQVIEALGIIRDKFRNQGGHSVRTVGTAALTVQTFGLGLLPETPDKPLIFGAAAPASVSADDAVTQIEGFLAQHGAVTFAAADAEAGKVPWDELIQLLPIVLDLLRRFWSK